jgi:hypothetical protein
MAESPNDERLLLAEDMVEIFRHGRSLEAACRVTFSLKTSPSVWVEIHVDPQMEVGAVARLTFRNSGITFDGFLTRASYSENVEAWFVPHLSGPISVGSAKPLTRVDFAFINFKQFYRQSADGPMHRNTADLCGGGWRVQIRPLPRDIASVDRYRRAGSGDRRFTHSASLTREDGSEFSSSDCRRALTALHVFLSFANGQWMTFVLVRGFTADGEIAWQEWGTRWIERMIEVLDVWMETMHGEALPEAFPGFMDAWNLNQCSKEAIHTAVYWFLRSNSLGAGADGGLLLTQAALESLSRFVLIEARGTLSKGGYKALRASDRIRRLLGELSIPIQIPSSSEQLVAATPPWEDGPHAVTSIRNSVTHSYESSGSPPVFEAWQLAQWYLELALLRLFEFNGSYSNRTKQGKYVGQVELVPWKI